MAFVASIRDAAELVSDDSDEEYAKMSPLSQKLRRVLKVMKRRRPSVNGFADKFAWEVIHRPAKEVCIGGPWDNYALFHPYWSNGTATVRCNKTINRQQGKVYWEVSGIVKK